MPVYPFACGTCGGFEVLRPMAAAGDPARCPACGGAARRVFSPPGLAFLAAPVRHALDREEKSAHEPEVVATRQGRPIAHHHGTTPPWVLSH